jgi:hypothetical protein
MKDEAQAASSAVLPPPLSPVTTSPLPPWSARLGERRQRGHVGGALDAGEEFVFRVGLVGQPFLRQRVGCLVLGIEVVDQVGELLFDDRRQRLGIGVGIDERQLAVADALLERGQLVLAFLRAAGASAGPRFSISQGMSRSGSSRRSSSVSAGYCSGSMP